MAEAMLKETELCLGLPGGPESTKSSINGKRGFCETVDLKLNLRPQDPTLKDKPELHSPPSVAKDSVDIKPPSKAQVVGWPPVRSYRKNVMAVTQKSGNTEESPEKAAYVKVSIDGAPYLRKVDLKMYKSYQELSLALGNMFSAFTTMGNYGARAGMIDFMNERKLMDFLHSAEYVPSYEDKDGDWMLVGDVPWEMFVDSCKRLRIMKGSEAVDLGLAPRAMEKCKNRT